MGLTMDDGVHQVTVKDDWEYNLSTVCICAVRYALGRKTYMPVVVQDFIKDSIDMMDLNAINIMINEIYEYGRKDRDMDNPYGMECDRESWINFLTFLKEEFTERLKL